MPSTFQASNPNIETREIGWYFNLFDYEIIQYSERNKTNKHNTNGVLHNQVSALCVSVISNYKNEKKFLKKKFNCKKRPKKNNIIF